MLEYILTKELGSKADYQREFGETPFGLLIRKIAKLEPQAAMEVFSDFIDDQFLNQPQIVFVHKVIDYVVQNGYIENVTKLMKPPFDKPKASVSCLICPNNSGWWRLSRGLRRMRCGLGEKTAKSKSVTENEVKPC